MTVEDATKAGLPAGGAVKAIQEVQNLKFAVTAGAAANANIAVAGIKTTDTLLAVVQFDLAVDTGTGATGNKVQALANLTAEASITSAGNIQCTTTNTTGDTLLVVYFSKPT